ncbi:ciliated left-right organizer metallopeptidase isoform X3 [Scyliorhinus torazame]|uniref:ciliated left-right organizer metallopeptidase isoform X3 n=1 Tax=Scyliorhinus torazame TaxID=75743 RepID=UPI003B5AB8E4
MRPLAARGRRFLRAVSLLAAALCCAGRCIHDVTQRRVDTATAVRYDGGRGVGRSGRPPPPPPRPIRIATHFITVPNMVLSHVDRVRLNNSIQQAVSLLAKLLAVIPVVDNLLLSRDMNEYCKSVWRNASLPNFNKCFQRNDNYRKETCLDVVIPDDHLQGYSVWPGQGNSPTVIQEDGRGVPNADLILYIKAADTSKCRKERSVIAYAAYCKLDQNGRPIAGAVTFCHSRLRGSAFDHRRTMLTTVHELLHVLGFSKDLYNTWLDCASAPSIGMNCSSRSSVTNTDDQGSVRIYTRTVIQKMQQHFNSSSPELGGPLENGVQPGFPSSHWESRFLQGSIMTAAMGAPEHTFIDPITLAAMSDTGWYQVTYDTTQPLVWGQGQGDTFGLTSSCHDNSSEYFCTGSGMGCHYLYLNKGHCASDEFLDGCRVYKPLVNGNQTSDASEPMGGRCYLHRLAGAEKEFQVQVQGSPWLPCRAGESVQVPGFRGVLACPGGRLCRRDDGRPPLPEARTPRAPGTGPASSSSSAAAPPPPPAGGGGQGGQPGGRIQVGIRVRESAECAEMEEREAEGAADGLANVTAIHRCHIRNPHTCSSLELCLELWEYAGCSQHSVPSLLQRLEKMIRAGNVQLKIAGKTCTTVSIRSSSGSSPPPAASTAGSVVAAAVCGSLGAAVAACGWLGVAAYRKLRGGRGRVHANSRRAA